MKIWLDDIREPPKRYESETWAWAKTPQEAIDLLELGTTSFMSFDHDLGLAEDGSDMTGYQVALWMAEHEVWPREGCAVHSHNPVGARRICGVVDRYGPYDRPCDWRMYGQ